MMEEGEVYRSDPSLEPVYRHCGLCAGDKDYDFVLKVESMLGDEIHMVRTLGLDKKMMFRHNMKNPRGKLTDSQKKLYFDMLTDKEIGVLYEIYRPDFEILEYTVEEIVGPRKF